MGKKSVAVGRRGQEIVYSAMHLNAPGLQSCAFHMALAFPSPEKSCLRRTKADTAHEVPVALGSSKNLVFCKKKSKLHALGVARNSLDHCRKWVLDTDPAKHASSPLYYTISNYITLYYTASDTFFLRLLTLAVMGVLINMRACVPMLA